MAEKERWWEMCSRQIWTDGEESYNVVWAVQIIWKDYRFYSKSDKKYKDRFF